MIDKRAQGVPGTHALVVGISEYPHLPGGTGPGGAGPFGLTQLSSAARSAVVFHDWLVNKAQLPMPLATSRLLLAPSPIESNDPRIPAQAAGGTIDDFLAAATGWIEDARRSDAEMTILYFSGHKLQISREEDILLFQDFGSSLGPSFRGAVSFANIFNGMAPSDRPIALTQIYFLDGSREMFTRPSLGPRLYGTTDVFDVLLTGPDRRSAAVFNAAAPGDQAWARPNGVTFFTQALIEGLEGAAAVPQSSSGSGEYEWAITIASLSQWLSIAGRRLSAELNVPVSFMTSGLLRDGIIAKVQSSPPVDVEIRVTPEEAGREVTVTIADQHGKPVTDLSRPALTHRLRLPAGFYALEIKPGPASKARASRRLVQILPPAAAVVVDVSE